MEGLVDVFFVVEGLIDVFFVINDDSVDITHY